MRAHSVLFMVVRDFGRRTSPQHVALNSGATQYDAWGAGYAELQPLDSDRLRDARMQEVSTQPERGEALHVLWGEKREAYRVSVKGLYKGAILQVRYNFDKDGEWIQHVSPCQIVG